jgi:1,4-dihydroxy-6-naphthoate synthase
MKLSLGFSPCPNDTFIFDALVNGRIDGRGMEFDVRLEDVETLNQAALTEGLDITKLSYHAYGHVMDKYILLNAGSALGEGCGPLLIAGKALSDSEINSGIIAVPGKLTTANFLFSLEYPRAAGKRYMPFDRIEDAVLSGEADAGVIIHENRFTYEARGLVSLCDLGDRWERSTGYPIPLGGIAIRRSLPETVKQAVDELIRRSVQYAFSHPQASRSYIKEHAQELADDVIDRHIGLYVNNYSVHLGEKGRAAVAFMLDKAAGLGIIEKTGLPVIL